MQPKGQNACLEVSKARSTRIIIAWLRCGLSLQIFFFVPSLPLSHLQPLPSPTFLSQPALAPAARRSPRSAAARPAAALPPAVVSNLFSVAATLAEAKPGEVDAPFGAIALGAVVVTGASLLLAQGLRGGGDAAEKIFERDSKTGRRR